MLLQLGFIGEPEQAIRALAFHFTLGLSNIGPYPAAEFLGIFAGFATLRHHSYNSICSSSIAVK